MKLKELQKKSDKTIKEVANDLGLPLSTYNNYLLGTREPNLATLKEISQYFNVSVDYLIENDIRGLTVYSEEQNQAINMLVQLNELNLSRASSYIAGLLVGQN